MNPAIFPSAFHPSLGGVEELVRQFTHELERRGDSPVLVANRWPRSLPAYEDFEGLPLHRVAMRVPTGSVKAHVNYRLTHRVIRQQVVHILRQHRADLVHVQCVSCNALYAIHASRKLNLPLVVTLQGELTMDANQIFQRNPYARNLMRAALSEADMITACSAATLAEAEAFFGRPFGDRGRVIYNGVSLAEFEDVPLHSHPRPYLFAIGRHVPQKGFDILLRAFAQAVHKVDAPNGNVPEAGAPHDLLLAGDGTETASLQRLAAELRIADRVHFLGRVDRSQAAGLFLGCEFFVLPSRHEPFGIVNLEAMAAGKAIVATRVGGVPEFVEHGANGLLVPPEDVNALAEAIDGLLHDPQRRDRLARAGLQRVRAFDWPVITQRYQAVYEEAIQRHHHNASPARKLAG